MTDHNIEEELPLVAFETVSQSCSVEYSTTNTDIRLNDNNLGTTFWQHA